MREDVLHRACFPNQRQAIEEAKTILSKYRGCVLNGEIGAGKGQVSLTLAYELGYKNVLYITEPRLVSEIEYHSGLNLITLKYSELKLTKNSLLCIQSTIKELTKDIDESYFVICDEVSNISNPDSQRGRLFLALRAKLSNNPFLLMSGTLKPAYNEQLVPYLYCSYNDLISYDLKTLYSSVKSTCDYYSPKVPISHVNRFATKTTDAHTDELKAKLDKITVRLEKVRKGDIKLYEHFITCSIDKEVTSKARVLKTSGMVKSKDVEYPIIKYHASQFQRIADGYILADNIDSTDRKVIEFPHNSKIEACRDILESKKNEKVIILCAFRECAEMVAKKLNAIHYDVTLNNKEAERLIEEFKTSEKNVLVSTLSALSTGFNLDEANTIVYYSLFYDFKACEQSFGRIDRATSTQDKHYYFLITDWHWEETKANKILSKLCEIREDFGFPKENVIKTYGSFYRH